VPRLFPDIILPLNTKIYPVDNFLGFYYILTNGIIKPHGTSQVIFFMILLQGY